VGRDSKTCSGVLVVFVLTEVKDAGEISSTVYACKYISSYLLRLRGRTGSW